ncbi:MAG TPA: HD-GYP domain-containing protein [Fimbriimonadaceae bacterium]|nr:HD-GYP domain-containing protein [Fimbriimonadaceae bacterium]
MRDIYRCVVLNSSGHSTKTDAECDRLRATVSPALKVLFVFLLASALWLEGACPIIDYLMGPHFDPADRHAIQILGYGLITAAFIFTAVLNIAGDLYRAKIKVRESQHELILRLGQASEWRDDETGDHTVRVGEYTAALARTLGWKAEECQSIEIAAMLHDIGKIGIPDFVMVKQGELSEEERELIHAHTLMGSDILANSEIPQVQAAQRIAESHHEWWDGTGYPYNLKGEEIPIEGRLVAVADVFDALTSRRRYKSKWTFEDAVAEIKKLSGTQFDPSVVEAFERALPEFRQICARHDRASGATSVNRAA